MIGPEYCVVPESLLGTFLLTWFPSALCELGSHLITVPAGVSPANAIVSSPIMHLGGMMGADGMGGAGAAAGGDNFDMYGGIDPTMDPELAMAIRASTEEARAQEEARMRAQQEASAAEGGGAAATPAAASSSSSAGEGKYCGRLSCISWDIGWCSPKICGVRSRPYILRFSKCVLMLYVRRGVCAIYRQVLLRGLVARAQWMRRTRTR
jgi:hypothetical protein